MFTVRFTAFAAAVGVALCAMSAAAQPAPEPPTPVVAPATAPEPAAKPAAPTEEAAKPAEVAAAEAPAEPFAFADFSWIPGNAGGPEHPLSTKYFTGELRVDVPYHYELSQPKDHTISGSSEAFRSNEFQLTQLGIGGDFHYGHVQARLMTQFGNYAMTTPRNDASAARGQWQLDNAYRYISEGYAGYHFDVMNGINVQAGIFMSYVGLWSYYNADNWTYQPSYVSSNTPWFFNGMRVQVFPSDKLKLEGWLVNGWQSYGQFNEAPGLGLQIQWRPTGWLSVLGNQYYGADTLGVPDRKRMHSDDSIMVKYHDQPGTILNRAAASLTLDAGCETGGGVGCGDQYFIGFMAYNRLWFLDNHFGLTVGGGAIKNPGRYLVLMPPINGATAYTASPYFTLNPGDSFVAWDSQVSADWSPEPYMTFRFEYNHRHASVPYFSGPGGVTPPNGSGAQVNSGAPGSAVAGWKPDLVQDEDRLTAALLLKL